MKNLDKLYHTIIAYRIQEDLKRAERSLQRVRDKSDINVLTFCG